AAFATSITASPMDSATSWSVVVGLLTVTGGSTSRAKAIRRITPFTAKTRQNRPDRCVCALTGRPVSVLPSERKLVGNTHLRGASDVPFCGVGMTMRTQEDDQQPTLRRAAAVV